MSRGIAWKSVLVLIAVSVAVVLAVDLDKPESNSALPDNSVEPATLSGDGSAGNSDEDFTPIGITAAESATAEMPEPPELPEPAAPRPEIKPLPESSRNPVWATADNAFLAEPVDANWAPVTESVIASVVASSGIPYEEAEILCKTTICRARFTHPTLRLSPPDRPVSATIADNLQAVVASDARPSGVTAQISIRPDSDGGGLVTTVFLDGVIE
jgi:hypothetical protein